MSFLASQTFQSTRPVRGATESHQPPREQVYISIHAPRAGRDLLLIVSRSGIRFQSTRPVRGATLAGYLLPLCLQISIHAPRAGRDYTKEGDIKQ